MVATSSSSSSSWQQFVAEFFGVENPSKNIWCWVAVVGVRRGFGALGGMGM
jgi:hypothetical protein